MTLTADKVQSGMDLIDLLLGNTDETSGCHRNQQWTIAVPDTLSPDGPADDDFLDALLAGSDTSSSPASPLWSPSTTDSSVTDDLLTDRAFSPHPTSCSALPAFDTQAFLQHPPTETHLRPDDKKCDVVIDLGWASHELPEQLGTAHYLSNHQSCPPPFSQTVTVRDLLLSNLGHDSRPLRQDPLQELQLNEDEKRLLTKEGVSLPSKLPLSKFEERVLKKIRRKIRNKHSAQESRKKKREYVDSLEGRISACSAHNLELRRKMQQLEETNHALLEQLSRLQALLPNSSNKTTHKGTCILVLLLSLSLVISSHLQPEPYSQLSRGEYTKTKVPSRSLHTVEEVQDVPPAALPILAVSRGFEALCSLTGKLWLWKSLPTVDFTSSPHKDHRLQDDH